MKKLSMIILSILSTQMLYSQTMVDSKVEYDENFNPTVKICLKNDASSKTITTVEVFVQYGTSDPYDWTHREYKKYTKKIQIAPSTSQWFSMPVAKTSSNYPPKVFVVSRVRYSDGTIWEHEIIRKSGGLL